MSGKIGAMRLSQARGEAECRLDAHRGTQGHTAPEDGRG